METAIILLSLEPQVSYSSTFVSSSLAWRCYVHDMKNTRQYNFQMNFFFANGFYFSLTLFIHFQLALEKWKMIHFSANVSIEFRQQQLTIAI